MIIILKLTFIILLTILFKLIFLCLVWRLKKLIRNKLREGITTQTDIKIQRFNIEFF